MPKPSIMHNKGHNILCVNIEYVWLIVLTHAADMYIHGYECWTDKASLDSFVTHITVFWCPEKPITTHRERNKENEY